MSDISWEIRPITRISEYHDCEEIQRRAWGFDGDLDVVPLTQMVAAHKAGGVVLGAFADGDRLGGFCYGFVGLHKGALLHHSHMLAVHPDYRDSGIGAALKWAQGDAVAEQGIEWMVWTYDPLESLNGYFNFSKLGIVAREYWEDLYGQTTSGLHKGTATDRLLAEWRLGSTRVAARRDGATPEPIPEGTPRILSAEPGDDGLLSPGAPVQREGAPAVAIEIPLRIQAIKAADPDLARAWRLATRSAFTAALADGFHVAECQRAGDRSVYLLRQGEPDFDA